MCGYFCTGFIDFMFANKTLINFTSLFSPYDFEKNYKIIFKYFLIIFKITQNFTVKVRQKVQLIRLFC